MSAHGKPPQSDTAALTKRRGEEKKVRLVVKKEPRLQNKARYSSTLMLGVFIYAVAQKHCNHGVVIFQQHRLQSKHTCNSTTNARLGWEKKKKGGGGISITV